MLVNPRVEAWSSEALIARLSASSGEEMWLMKVDPRCSSFFAESVKIQAVPACLEDAIQEASVKHRIVSVGALGAGADGFRDLVSGDVGWFCAIAHSLADMIALDMVEDGVMALFSKIRRFLEVQIATRSMGRD
ncbi:hypothetical protein Bca4012_033428 [Brassica carinata]